MNLLTLGYEFWAFLSLFVMLRFGNEAFSNVWFWWNPFEARTPPILALWLITKVLLI